MALLLPVTRVVIPRFGYGGQTPAPAAVAIVDAFGNPAGWGASNDPGGIFFGMSPFPYSNTDLWWASSVPAGITITPQPGGSYGYAVALGTPSGSKPWTWTVQDVFGNRTSGVKVDAST